MLCQLRYASRINLAILGLSLLAAASCGARQVPAATSAPAVQPGVRSANAAGERVAALDKCIFVIFQASDGSYWFGSDGQGVFHHDGKTLVRFSTGNGLRGNRIRSIQEDRAGNILVSGDGGVSLFDGRAFRPLEVAADDAKGWRLSADDLWFTGWQDEGVVYRYDGAALHRLAFPKTPMGDDHLKRYPRAQFPAMTFNPYDVYTIFKDSRGDLWFGTHVLGACRYDGTNFEWASKPELGFDADDSFGLRSILEDKDGKFWFSNTRNRFDVHPPSTDGASARSEGGLRYRSEPGFAGGQDGPPRFMSSLKDAKGDVWMVSLRDGVWQYDGDRLTHHRVEDGGAAVMLFSIYKDKQGVLWLGSHEHGAYRFNGTAFEKFKV